MVESKDMDPFPPNFGKVFWNNQFRTTIELPTLSRYSCLKVKLAIITGANSGLGLESARQLLTLGLSHLVVAVRSIEKGQAAAALLRNASASATIDVWSLDMESYESVQDFARKCEKELSRIDYVILNAGLSPLDFQKSPEGHERTIQVNHLSTALLAVLLLPVLKAKREKQCPARLTVVNSVMAHLCKFPNRDKRPLLGSFDDKTIPKWDPQERYGVSKLLNQLFLMNLTELVSPDDVIINMVDPGLTKGTALFRDGKGLLLVVMKIFLGACGRPLANGAATYVDAILGHGKETHGCFLMNTQISPLSTFYYTDTADEKKARKQVWKETMEELSFGSVEKIILSMK